VGTKKKITSANDPAESEKPAEPRQLVNLLKVPIDIVEPETLSSIIIDLAKDKKEHNIVLLSLWDLLRARRNGEYRNYILNASMVVPISKSIISGVKFLTGKTVYRFMPFDFIISALTALESRELSCYLLGGDRKALVKTEQNIRQTFPKLRVVGRFHGYFKKHEESTIIKAITKSSPSLLLVGRGVRGKERWISKNNQILGEGIRLWCSDIFDVFAEKKKHPSQSTFDAGLESIGYCFQNPFKFFRIFPYIGYKFMLLYYKLFKK